MARLMTPAEIAKYFGVDRSTVTRWLQRGRIKANDDGLIDVDLATKTLTNTQPLKSNLLARVATHEMNKTLKKRGKTANSNDGLSMLDPETVAMRYKAAMAREREAKAELAAMEVDRQAGLLLDRQDVDFVLADLGNTLRVKLENVEDTLTERVLPLGNDAAAVRHVVRETLREVLEDISELMNRRMREVTSARDRG
jgi:phage terminase Nu1 subunit (DNA packaging protein)